MLESVKKGRHSSTVQDSKGNTTLTRRVIEKLRKVDEKVIRGQVRKEKSVRSNRGRKRHYDDD